MGWTTLIQTALALGVGIMLGMNAEGDPIWLMVLAWVLILAGCVGHVYVLTRRRPPQKPQPK